MLLQCIYRKEMNAKIVYVQEGDALFDLNQ